MSNIGCRIFTKVPRAPREMVERFRGLPVANIGDNMNRMYCVDGGIRSVNGKPMLGTAFTLHLPSGDNLMFHKAFELALPGDVLVIASGGNERSYCGELMMMCARNRGLAGFAIDGCIRDVEEASTMDFPVYARGVNPQGPFKFGYGELNVPIAFGGQVVFPGDIVVGDRDGLIFVRPGEAEQVLEKSWAQNKKENELHALYDGGSTAASFNKELMDTALAQIKCETVENSWNGLE